MHRLTLFASKPTSARIDYLRQDGRLMAGKATQNVKIHAEKRTDLINELTRRQEDKMTRKQEHKLAKERVNKWMRRQVNK